MVSGQQQRILSPSPLDSVSRQRAWVEIDLKALAHNVRTLKAWLSPTTKLMAVVKADAYGHGVTNVARTALANGADSLAIATLAEGVELRRFGITAPILILDAINSTEDIKAVAAWELSTTIVSTEQASVFNRTLTSLGESVAVHLQLDTGMSRFGTDWQDAVEFVSHVRSLSHLNLVRRLFSLLHC